ncbi:MAG: MGMT family protein [Clostridia bacterium]|nr:MGMT family protein [Clostridia bacterium]
MTFFETVYEVVKQIPSGKVLSYGDVARLAGNPKMSRQVGWALHNNPQPGVIPCHRVVFKDGSLTRGFAFGGAEVQRDMLLKEGVEVSEDFKINMKKFRWEV